jgi:hypothetical protein
MTREEARAWLDVVGHVDDVGLRRAYLRKIKAHKPERDPEGFKKCREAYELLTQPADAYDGAGGEGAREDGAREEGAREDRAREHRAREHRAAVDRDAAKAPPAAHVPRPVPRTPDSLVREALAPLRAMASATERLAHLRALLGQYPDSVLVVRELELELCAGDRFEEAADVLRVAIDRGVHELDAVLFARHASRLTDDEVARLEGSGHPDRDRLVLLALVTRKRWGEVERRALEALRRSEHPLSYLIVALELFARERARSARAVLGAIEARLTEQGGAMRLRNEEKLHLLLVSELAGLRLSRPLLATMALDLRRASFHETRAFLIDVEHYEAREALAHLAARAPALRRLIGQVVIARPKAEIHPEALAIDGRQRVLPWVLGGVLVAVLAFVGITVPIDGERIRVATPTFDFATALVRMGEGEAPVACRGDDGCARAQAISLLLDTGDCAGAFAELEVFERDHTARMDRFALALRARALAHCPH